MVSRHVFDFGNLLGKMRRTADDSSTSNSSHCVCPRATVRSGSNSDSRRSAKRRLRNGVAKGPLVSQRWLIWSHSDLDISDGLALPGEHYRQGIKIRYLASKGC